MPPSIVTPEGLKKDNHSSEVTEYLKNWQEHFDENNIIFILSCSDSRLVVPRNATADIRSIGAAALPEFYSSILNKKVRPQVIVVIMHHDGNTVKPGRIPQGCGGLRVKEALKEENSRKHKHPKIGYSVKYVEEYIVHQDPFIQGVFTGEEIAELSNRPVLVATEDHRTGQLYPLATFLPKYERGLLIRSAIPLRSGFQGRYNPKKIYSSGIPFLTSDQIPEEFNIRLVPK